MTSPLAKYLTRAVPRYTSYPTAPHFHDGIDGSTYASWLGKLDPEEPISLYLHVPFCKSVCWYCGCNMKLVGERYCAVTQYVDALVAEIELISERLPAKMAVSHIHFGGGTPTVLTGDDLARVMAMLSRSFNVLDNAEIAIEADPRTFTEGKAIWLGALGFNRASFGVQEFDPKVQEAINRVQPPEMVESAVNALRSEGVQNINFDLIYGLPHQTTETLVATVERCLEMAPDRIALFGYAHVPWMAKRQRMIDTEALPGAAARLDQAERAAEALVAGGMVPIGLDHFAQPSDELAVAARKGTLRRNFQGYTTDGATTLLGLGATSIGRTPSGYVQNVGETGAYMRAVREGRPATHKGIAVSGEDLLRADVIETLMCDRAVDLEATGRRHDAPPAWADAAVDALTPLINDGFVETDGPTLSVTPEGRPLMRVIASAFDGYYDGGLKRHSVAV